MTASAMPPSRRRPRPAAIPAISASPRGFADIFDEMFGEFMGGRARRSGARQSRQRSALQSRDHARGSLQGPPDARSACRRSRHARPATAAAREPGSKPVSCPTCHGSGRVRAQQGFFTIERTCPTCHGAGTRDREAVPLLRRPGPRAQGEDAHRHHPARRRGRHAHPPRRRGRGRRARRRRRAISTSSSP